jgi:hypothetical protein
VPIIEVIHDRPPGLCRVPLCGRINQAGGPLGFGVDE